MTDVSASPPWEPLLAAGQIADACSVLEQQAGAGNAQACFRLAGLYLIGSALPRDLPRARALLRQAVTIGHVDAALLEIALTANGAGAAPSWSEARALLDQAARNDPVAAAHQAMLAAMSLDRDGFPTSVPRSTTLSGTPYVSRFTKLFTPAECAHVANTASDLLEPATIIDPASGRSMAHPIRTSDSAVIGPAREDLVIRALNQRLAAISDSEVGQGEALTVLRYRPGEQYRPHLDTFTHTRNQRFRTIIVYLNEGFTGGETVFAKADLKVAPKMGDAIMFDNVTNTGAPDMASQHAGLPVRNGVKWIATRWLRERSFDQWTGPEAV